MSAVRDYDKILRREEKAVYDLRELYRSYGYARFKMSKFEEYELYAHNKDFLVSDGILTFMNGDGKLMALKPDVTLSIVKNSADEPGLVQKMYYNENVYRIDRSTHEFREIMQTGVECIGDIAPYDVCEVIMLALDSLDMISGGDYVLDISHMAVAQGLVAETDLPEDEKRAVLKCIAEKNAHGIAEICDRNGIPQRLTEKLTELVSIYGDMDKVLERLGKISPEAGIESAVRELGEIRDLIKRRGLYEKVHFDFSILNDMGYYNGVVFQGFINGVPSGVLSGGRYDRLMEKMGRKSGAVGFAVYLDALERLDDGQKQYDVDIVLLYGENDTAEDITAAVKSLAGEGYSVSAQKKVPQKLKFMKLCRLDGGEVKTIETNG